MDERELKEIFLQGDREAFQKVVAAYGSQMMSLSLSVVGNREDAEDVCQEAFLQAFRHCGRFDPNQSLRHWLLTIVYRRSLDVIRRKKRQAGFLNRLKQNLFLSSAESPEATFGRQDQPKPESRRELLTASLPARRRF